jgi:anti-sigma factor RsiW
MVCSDFSDDMMEVLYGEAPPSKVQRLEEHLKTCPACRAEMQGFEGVRRKLGAWSVPQLSRATRPSPWILSFRGLAAAALVVLSFGAGLGLSGSELRYAEGRWSFRLGRSEREMTQALEVQRARLSPEQPIEAPKAASLAPVSDDALLRRVEGMIRSSDERQAELVRTRLEAYSHQIETQRRLDLARVSAGLSYLDGKTGQDVARTAQLVGYVLQASDKR